MVLRRAQLAAIRDHAACSAPEECCGILLGEGGRVEEVRAAENVAETDRTRNYVIDVRALLDAHRHARERGWVVLGYYHSHPAGAAHPSRSDLEHALPEATYVIVGLAGDPDEEIRAWQLCNGDFTQEPVEICPE